MAGILCGPIIQWNSRHHDLGFYGGDPPKRIRDWEGSRNSIILEIPALGYAIARRPSRGSHGQKVSRMFGELAKSGWYIFWVQGRKLSAYSTVQSIVPGRGMAFHKLFGTELTTLPAGSFDDVGSSKIPRKL